MECPFCSHENIEGADQCARCQTDLANFDESDGHTDMERDLLTRPLGDLLNRAFVEVPPDCTVRQAIAKFTGEAHRCAIVVDAGEVVGILTERDILAKLADVFEAHADEPIRKYMTAAPATLDVDDAVAFALNRMMNGGYRHIPLLKNGELAGVVSVRDILAYISDRFPDVIESAPATAG